MDNTDRFLTATATIDGEQKDFYRNGKIEGFYIPKTLRESEIQGILKEI